MRYLNLLYPRADALSRRDLAQLEIEGMRRNSFIVTLCSLTALTSVTIVGAELLYLGPVVLLAVASFIIGVYLKKEYLLFSQRLLVAISFLAVSILVSNPISISSAVIFVPIFTFIYCTEQVRFIRWFYSILLIFVFFSIYTRAQPGSGATEVSEVLLNIKIAADCLLATVFTGLFLRMYSVYSRVAIEVTKSHAVKLEQSVNTIESTITDLESQLNRLSDIQRKTSTALANKRMATGEIKASQEQMFQFAYAASHDLKEPIRTVRSFYQVIRRRLAPEVLAKAKISDLFNSVEERSAGMHAMLERLLQYSRISSKERVMNVCSIQELVNRAVALHYEKLDMTVDIQEGCDRVLMDANCVNQIFQELIKNSIAFANPIRPLKLNFKAQKLKPGFVTCSFEDNGSGMSKEVLDKAVDLFQRFDGPSKNAGSGLGLSIVKAIVAKEGGQLWLTSDGESGTSVHFDLPSECDTPEGPEGQVLQVIQAEKA